MKDCVVIRGGSSGDFLDIPPRAVIARTDPNEQESVVLLDEQGRKS